MFAALGAIAGKLPLWIYVAAGLIAVNYLVENPLIRKNARQGYVAQAEKAALEAELAEARRQAKAAEAVTAAWVGRFNAMQAQNEKDDLADAAEIEKMEAELKASGRSCRLGADDLKYLR